MAPRAASLLALLLAPTAAQQVASQAVWMPVDADTPGAADVTLVSNGTHAVSFGGIASDAISVNGPSAFNYASNVWTTQPSFPGASYALIGAASAPFALGTPAVAAAYLFGGATSANVLSYQVVLLTPTGATQLATTGTPPSPRKYAAAVYLSNCFPGTANYPYSYALGSGGAGACLVVYGGSNAASLYLSDLYILDLRPATPIWSSPTTAGAAPGGRYGHAGVASGDGYTATFFGGRTLNGVSNDMFSFAPAGFAVPLATEMANLAMSAAAVSSQSTTDPLWAGNAERGNDGLINTDCNGAEGQTAPGPGQVTYNLCTGTKNQTNPWWRVDLGSTQTITTVKVWGRTDCCVDRIDGFQVAVAPEADAPADQAAALAAAIANHVCFNPWVTIPDPPAVVDMTLTPGCTSARYVYVYLPGTAKYLSVIEVQVLSPLPYVWRQLSGLAQVATNKPAVQSSTELCCLGGDPARAVDGDPSQNNYNFGSCSHTQDNTNDQLSAAWWRLDLGKPYDVSSINIWPRTDCCNGRNTRVHVYAGLSTDTNYDFEVPNVPVNIGPAAGAQEVSLTWPTPVSARFITITRDYLAGDDNILALCEVQVMAQLLTNMPSPRNNPAAVGYQGTMIIFGGTNAAGLKLNDLRVFDMVNTLWLPPVAPLGDAPPARSSAALLVLGSLLASSKNQILMFGGNSASSLLADVYYYNAAGCPALTYPAGALTGGHFGTYTQFTCPANTLSTNNGNQIVCDATTGIWRGLYNLATGQVCIAAPISGATVSVDSVTSTTANLSYTLPAGSTTGLISTAPDPTYTERFNSIHGPADFAANWTWQDPTTFSRYSFLNGRMRIDATQGADCTGSCPTGPTCLNTCPSLSRTFPMSAPGYPVFSNTDYEFEAWVGFDSNVVQETQFAGIGLMNRPVGGSSTLSLYAGLYLTAGSYLVAQWQVGFSTPTSSCQTWLTFDYPLYAAWMRIERITPAGATSSTFRVAYRLDVSSDWLYIGAPCSESQLPGGSLPPSQTRPAALVKNSNAAVPAAALIDNMRISSRACRTMGNTRIIGPYPAGGTITGTTTISGLTPGTPYFFQALPGTAASMGLPSVPVAGTTLAAAPTPTPLLTGNLAQNRPTQIVTLGTASGYGANQGVNGVIDQVNNYFTTGPAPCSDIGCWWQVDLGSEVDVRLVTIYNRADPPANAAAAGIVVYISDAGGPAFLSSGIPCSPVPASLVTAPFQANVTCAEDGQFLTILAPVGVPLSLSQVQVFAANSCPSNIALFATQNPGSNCAAGAPLGTVCSQSCNANSGYVATAGSTLSTCQGASWSGSPLSCEPFCGELFPAAPASLIAACSRTLIADDFSQPLNGSLLGRWFPLDNTKAIGSSWFVTDGELEASAAWGCEDELLLVAGSDDVANYRGDYSASVYVYTSDRAGIIRAVDVNNYLRFYIDVIADEHVLDVMVGGVRAELTDADLILAPATWYLITLSQTGSLLNISIDGVQLLSTSFSSLAAGYMGVYAGTSAMFDNFQVTVPCSTSCPAGAAPRDTCTFTCSPGYVPVGNATSVCTNSPNGTASWTGAALSCVQPAPTFNSATRTVPENSVKGTPVGAPLVVFNPDPTAVMSFAILSQLPTNGIDATGAFVFAIDSCAGQITVYNPVLDYELINRYVLNVSVTVLGSSPLIVEYATVTILIGNVNEPPIIISAQSFNMSETAPVKTQLGHIVYWDPENNTATFSLVVDGSNGIVGLNATTAWLYVAALGANYLHGAHSYSLQVQARDNTLATNIATSAVTVAVLDAPNYPVIPSGQLLTVAATAGGAIVATTALAPTLTASLDDNLMIPPGPYNSSLIYSVMSYATGAAQSACGLNITGVTVPTVSGSAVGSAANTAPLFTITAANANTGIITVAATPTVLYTSLIPKPVGSVFAYASYTLCVNVTTKYGKSSFSPVTVAVTSTQDGSTPYISGYSVDSFNNGSLVGPNGAQLDTVNSTKIHFIGVGFTTATVTAIYTNGVQTYNATGCLFVSATVLTCNTVPGVGANLMWSVYMSGGPTSGLAIASTVALLTSYYPPQITSLGNNTAIPTAGGAEIVLMGRYLGINGSGVLSYGSSLTNLVYTCNLQKPSWALNTAGMDSVSSCPAARGAGAGLAWSLTVGGQTITSATKPGLKLTYALPVITSVTLGGNTSILGVGANLTLISQLNTRGCNDTSCVSLLITGTNFGGVPTNVRTALLSASSILAAPLPAMVCTSITAATSNTQMTCFIPPGVGFNLGLTVTVDGQTSAKASGLGYASPSISGLAGTYRSMSTAGGDAFIITGDMFGPAATFPNWVRYGPLVGAAPTKYTAGSPQGDPVNQPYCTVTTPHTAITCLTAPGTGTGFYVQLAVGGQNTSVFRPPAAMGYAAPVITSFAVSPDNNNNNISTSGGSQVTITGANFGPLIIPPVVVSGYYRTSSTGGGRPGAMPAGGYLFVANNCSVTIASTGITCYTAPGAGANLQWTIIVDGQSSVTPTTSYGPPIISVIWDITGNLYSPAAVPTNPDVGLDPNGQYRFRLTGINFGQANNPQITNFTTLQNASTELINSISYGPTGTEYSVLPSQWFHVSDSVIELTVGPASGANCFFSITVGGQTASSATPSFSFASPQITGVSPQFVGPTANNLASPYLVTLTVIAPILDPLSSLTVQLGSGNKWIPIIPNLPSAPDIVVGAPINIQVPLPLAWAGQMLSFKLKTGTSAGGITVESPLTAASSFSYSPPTITTVYVTPAVFSPANASWSSSGRSFLQPPCPWTGSSQWVCNDPSNQMYEVVVIGSNFGPSSAVPAANDPVTRHIDFTTSVGSNGTLASEASWIRGGSAPSLSASPYTVFYWTDSRVILYTYQSTGTVSVRLTNEDYAGGQQTVSSSFMPYSPGQPALAVTPPYVTGQLYNASTAGGSQLTINLAATAPTDVAVTVGGAPCPLSSPSGTTMVTCTIPPGQGTQNLVAIFSPSLALAGADATLAAVVQYSSPALSYITVQQYDGTGVNTYLSGNGPVMMPTNGSTLTVYGYNLGTSPVLIIASATYTIPVAGTPCTVSGGGSGTVVNGSVAPPVTAPLTCASFAVPAGQGSGFWYSNGVSGFSLYLVAGNQDSRAISGTWPFSYNYPTVLSVSSSATGNSIPPFGRDASGNNITLTLTGRDFGTPITSLLESQASSGLTVWFGRPQDAGGINLECLSPQRLNDFTITCILPPGAGANLTFRISAMEIEWTGLSSPAGFSYDAPVIFSAFAAVRALQLPAPPCVNTTTETYDNVNNETVYVTISNCSLPPPPAFSPMSASPSPAAVAFALPGAPSQSSQSPSLWHMISGGSGVAPVGSAAPGTAWSFASVAAAPGSSAGAHLTGPTLEFLVDSNDNPVLSATGALQYYTFITLYGQNFGARNPLNCPNLAWSNRNPAYAGNCACDNREGFLGEGEIEADDVLFWNDTMIVYIVPQGAGVKDVDVCVRGGRLNLPFGSSARPRFQYMAPIITAADPGVMDAAGGSLITLTGVNFGPVPFGFGGSVGSAIILDPSNFNVPLWSADGLPTFSQRIQFTNGSVYGPGSGPQCVSSALRLDGSVSPFASTPTVYADCITAPPPSATHALISITNTTLTFYAPPGVGARSVYVSIVDGPSLDPTYYSLVPTVPTVILSNPLPVAFSPPVLDCPSQTTYRTFNGSTPVSISLSGNQFGNSSLDTDPRYVSTDRWVNVTMSTNGSSIVCSSPKRSLLSVPLGSSSSAVVTCTVPAVMPVGYYNVSMVVAGQSATGSCPIVTGCEVNFFAASGEYCAPCPYYNVTDAYNKTFPVAKATCAGYLDVQPYNATNNRLPLAVADWFDIGPFTALTSSAKATCPQSMMFNSTNASQRSYVCLVPCPYSSCLAANTCAQGYRSTAPYYRCASCDSGYFRAAGFTCLPCPSTALPIIIMYVLAVLAAASAGYLMQKNGVTIAVMSIGIDFFQVVAIFASSKVAWTQPVSTLLLILSASNMNVAIVAPECLASTVGWPTPSFVSKFAGIVLLPLLISGLFVAIHAALLVYKVAIKGQRKNVGRHAPLLISSILSLVYFLYLYETSTLLEVFNCAPTAPSDGFSYLNAVFEPCNLAGGSQMTLLPWAIIGLVVYTAGYPAFVAGLLWKYRELIMEDQLLRAKGVGADRLTNPHAYDFRRRWSRLYYQFKPDFLFWTLLVVLRKFLIVLVMVLFNRDASFQMAACIMILVCAYGMQLRNNPYMPPAAYEAVLRSHAESSFTSAIHARIRASIAGIESRGRKKSHRNLMDYNGRVDRTAVLGVLTSWAFDHNTVESVLIFAAIMVCVMGMLVSSDALQTGLFDKSADTVTGIIIAIIALSAIYYFVVLATEIMVLTTEHAREKRLLSTRRKSKLASSGESGSPGTPRSGNASRQTLQTGPLDVALNPLFTSAGSNPKLDGVNSAMDAVRAFTNTVPPLELWRVIAASYEGLESRAESLSTELAQAKVALERAGGTMPVEGAGGAPERRGSTRGGGKTAFQPMASASTDAGAQRVGQSNGNMSQLAGYMSARKN